MLRAQCLPEISNDGFMLGALAWGDILVSDWRLLNLGVILEFSLHETIGRLPRDEWRGPLNGKFLTPIVPDRLRKSVKSFPTPRPTVTIDGVTQAPLNEMHVQGPVN
jgi:hypothetical protein